MRILKLFVALTVLLTIPGRSFAECEYFENVKAKVVVRKSFMAHFNYAMSLPLMLYGDYKRQNDHLYKPYVYNNQIFTLDRMTIACLECHGTTLLAEKDKLGNVVLERGFHGLLGKHAIGLNYNELVLTRPGEFQKPDPKRNNIVFVGGKLGCVSCHNPFSTLPFHLNVLEKDLALCKECHIR